MCLSQISIKGKMLRQASVLGVVMLWLHKQDQSLKKLTELCIDQIIGINHGEEGEKEDAR